MRNTRHYPAPTVYPLPGIRPAHTGYLPHRGTKEACEAIAPGPVKWECTREEGHDGDHAAHDLKDRMYATWPQEAEAK